MVRRGLGLPLVITEETDRKKARIVTHQAAAAAAAAKRKRNYVTVEANLFCFFFLES